MRVVDTHFHWFPRSHFETMAARSGFPRTERVGDGYRYLYNNGKGFIPLPAKWYDLDAGFEASYAATGRETVVVCTTGVLAGMLDQMPATEALDVAFAYNEEIAGAQRRFPGRFFGTAAIPLQDTDSALKVLDHAVGSLGLRGVNLPSMIGPETVDVERLEPFYARVAELDVPLIVHPTDLAFNEVLTGYQDGIQRSLGRLLDSSVTVLRLIFSGIMERHPSLRIVQTHAGGLLPYQAGRIDKNARIEGLPSLPSHYLRRVFVDTVAPQSLTIRTALEYYGPDNILYGTDHPCWSPAAAVSILGESALAEEVRTKIYSTNAQSVFRLD
ncbi:amidohydrolase family protein [Amycolatopsis sp. NPDC004368]